MRLAIGLIVCLAAGGVARADCLSEFPNVVRPTKQATIAPPPSATIDLRGTTLRGMGRGGAKSILTVQGFKGVCILGGRLLSEQDPQVVPWVEGHREYGAGILLKSGSGRVVAQNVVIADSLQDGITIAGGLPDDVSFELLSSWIANTSDDGIQNDGGKRIAAIEDSLIEAKMGLSLRSGRDSRGDSFGSGVVPIRDSLIDIICVADDRPDGSDRRDAAKARRNNCGPGRSTSWAFKWGGDASATKVDVSNTVIRLNGRNRNGWKANQWPPGTYRDVTLVWDPATHGMVYDGPSLPAGVTLTTDRTVWDEAKTKWLTRHGCSEADRTCTFAPPDPVDDLIARLRGDYPAAGLTDSEWRTLIGIVRDARL